MKTVRLRTVKEQQLVSVKFRVVPGLTQPILSVSKLSESGKEVVLGSGYAYIKKIGDYGPDRLELACVGSLYYLTVLWTPPAGMLAPLDEAPDEDAEEDQAEDEEADEEPNQCIEEDEVEAPGAKELVAPGAPTAAERRHHDLTHLSLRELVRRMCSRPGARPTA